MPKPPIKPKTQKGGSNAPSEDPWTILQRAITNIFNQQQSNLCLSELHSEVNHLVAMNQSNKIDTGLHDLLKEQFQKWHDKLSKIAGNPLLVCFSGFYDDFIVYCSVIPKVFMLYDKYYKDLNNTNESQSCSKLRTLFKDIILSDRTLIDGINTVILSEILNARRDLTSSVNLSHVHNLIGMYYSFRDKAPQDTTLFNDFFEDLFHKTTEFYDEFFTTKFHGNSFSDYLTATQQQYEYEETILNSILQKEAIQELLLQVYQCLLHLQEDSFLKAATVGGEPPIASALIAADSRPMKWLVDMYKQFKVSLKAVFTSCARFVYDEMMKLSPPFQIEMKASDITQHVQELIQKTESLEEPYKKIFKGIKEADDELQKQIKRAWNSKDAFNIIPNFCTYLHQIISSEFKTFSPEDRDKFPGIFAKFFARTEERLEFSQLYEKEYVRRFIKMGSKLHDIEGPLITHVQKVAKASDFAKSFEDFNNKIKESNVIIEDFKNYQRAHSLSFQIGDFHPIVFDARTYPLDRVKINRLPSQLTDINNAFTAFYVENHPKGKLELLSDVSIVESKLRVPKTGKTPARTYTISSDIVCASILYLVGQGKEKKLGEIYDEVGEDKGRIGLYIKRLCQKSCPILLRKVFTDKKLQESDIFCLNPAFAFSSSKVTVQPIDNVKSGDIKNTQKSVEMDKSKAIQAAVIRCLKARNVVPIDTCINEVIQMTSQYFRADAQAIKRELNYLETEDYFDRSGPDNTILTYHQ